MPTRPAPTAPVLPTVQPGMGFDEASVAVLDHLVHALPMGLWAVTRYDGVRQLSLEVRGDAYAAAAGDAHRWADSFCIHMAAGRAPGIAPDAMGVPAYAAAGVARQLAVGAYVGILIRRADGALFGTLYGLDPRPLPEEVHRHAPLLGLLSQLLSTIWEADLQRTEAARALERAELAAETDDLTGLTSRRGWDRLVAREEPRAARFGDPAGIVVVDLDDVEAMDDASGHDAGDRHLRAAGAALRRAVRATDVVARLGGDQLGVLARNSGDDDRSRLVARVVASLAAAGVPASVGHAPWTLTGGFTGALAAADAARCADEERRRRGRTRR